MPARNVALTDHLSRYHEIKISVTGKNSGRMISIPVWFVLDSAELYLLPVQGSDTQWYRNVLKKPWGADRGARCGGEPSGRCYH
jgi:hypothetical protein